MAVVLDGCVSVVPVVDVSVVSVTVVSLVLLTVVGDVVLSVDPLVVVTSPATSTDNISLKWYMRR